jgi:hypothetical protein
VCVYVIVCVSVCVCLCVCVLQWRSSGVTLLLPLLVLVGVQHGLSARVGAEKPDTSQRDER